jgi:hypothetical protein
MENQIIQNINSMIGYLEMVRDEVKKGTPEKVDSLDVLEFVGVGLSSTYKDIKQQFHLSD